MGGRHSEPSANASHAKEKYRFNALQYHALNRAASSVLMPSSLSTLRSEVTTSAGPCSPSAMRPKQAGQVQASPGSLLLRQSFVGPPLRTADHKEIAPHRVGLFGNA